MSVPIRVIHKFHPLYGQELDFVERASRWGDDLIFYRDHRGYIKALPASWTSVEAEDPFIVVSAGRSLFRVADLIDLTKLIGELQTEKPATGGQNEL